LATAAKAAAVGRAPSNAAAAAAGPTVASPQLPLASDAAPTTTAAAALARAHALRGAAAASVRELRAFVVQTEADLAAVQGQRQRFKALAQSTLVWLGEASPTTAAAEPNLPEFFRTVRALLPFLLRCAASRERTFFWSSTNTLDTPSPPSSMSFSFHFSFYWRRGK
jgi:hypothetical protein